MKILSFIEDSEVIKKILQRRTSPQALRTVGDEGLPTVCLEGLTSTQSHRNSTRFPHMLWLLFP